MLLPDASRFRELGEGQSFEGDHRMTIARSVGLGFLGPLSM
jgi:hypothetical protein